MAVKHQLECSVISGVSHLVGGETGIVDDDVELAPLVDGSLDDTLAKVGVELSVLRYLRKSDDPTLKRSALLLTGELGPTFQVRLICALVGGVSLPIAWLNLAGDQPGSQLIVFAVSAATAVVLLSGELLERNLFFTAVVAPKMPRGL